MSTIVSLPKFRVKLDRPLPAPDHCTNSSQVRRLLTKVMSPDTPRQERSDILRIAMGILLICTLATAAIVLGGPWNGGQTQNLASAPGKDDRTAARQFKGIVVPARTSDLAFPRPGRIKRVLIKEGQIVEAGTLLAELETDAIEAELNVARTELKMASYKVNARATSSVRRSSTVTTERSFDSTLALNEHWTAVVKQLELQLTQCKLTAPYTGMITHVDLFEGSAAAPGQTAMKLVSHADVKVKVSLPAKESRQLRNLDKATIQIGAHRLKGQLQALIPDGNGSQSVTAVIEVAGIALWDAHGPAILRLDALTRAQTEQHLTVAAQ